MVPINLSGKNALITGGTRGIGRAIANKLAAAGADLALIFHHNQAAATAAQSEIQAATGRRVEIYQADVADAAQVESLVADVVRDFGTFSVVVHNAGGGDGGGAMPDVRPEQWQSVMGVNLDAAYFLTRAMLLGQNNLANPASIVFIASGAGHDPMGGLAAYGAAKAGLIHFGQTLAQDIGPRGIRVNVVSPGFTDTGHASAERKESAAKNAALGRCGISDDVAGAVLFFASDLSSFVTGQWLRVNGGTV